MTQNDNDDKLTGKNFLFNSLKSLPFLHLGIHESNGEGCHNLEPIQLDHCSEIKE